jgi:cyanophycinase
MLWVSLVVTGFLCGSRTNAESIGPEHGSLVIVGGGAMPKAIVDEFISRAGGKDAAFVIIPTADVGEEWGEDYLKGSFLTRAGVHDITVLHTRDPQTADTEEFVAPLKRAGGVWIGGGRQWRLADAYLKTRTVQEMWGVLHRGGVIGGSSAGATIQSSYLVRGAPEGNTIMMSPGHEEGFSFLKRSAIDQHVIARGRENDLVEVIDAHPDLLGIGIDEGTAIVVEGNRFRVIGKSQVLIHDAARATEDGPRYESLKSGDAFDLESRKRLDVSASSNANLESQQH